jgi:hypothetical protein
MSRISRITKTWVPHVDDEEKKWPFDNENFGDDFELYKSHLRDFVIDVDETGKGIWSMGLQRGTLRLVPGSATGYHQDFVGTMTVSSDENSVGTANWTASLKMFCIPGKNSSEAKVIWNWNNGPCKGKAVTTYWKSAASSMPPKRRSSKRECVIS